MNEEITIKTSSENIKGMHLSKTELEKKLEMKDVNLTSVYPTKIKSDVWCMFRIAVYKGVKQHFVTCIECNAVLAYKSKTGNASLLRHKCYKKPENIVLKKYLDASKMKISSVMSYDIDSTDSDDVVIKIEPNMEIDTNLPEYTIEEDGLSAAHQEIILDSYSHQNILLSEETELQLSKVEIEAKLQSHDRDITSRGPDKSKNALWKKFKIIYYKGIKQGYAVCIECKTILSYKKKTGCASLLRHKCNKKKLCENKDVFVLQSLQPSSSSGNHFESHKPIISNEQITTIGRSQAYFVYKDLRPIDMFDDEKFRNFMQTMLSIGANFGTQNINTIISHGTNVRSILTNMSEEIKDLMKIKFSENKHAFTFDIWSNGNVKFLTVFSYFINEFIELKKYYLGTRIMYKSTVLEINTIVINILQEYVDNPVDLIKNSILVIEKTQTNISNAFRDATKSFCACEMISIIIEKTLEAKHEKLVSIFDAIETLQQFDYITIPTENILSTKFEIKIALLNYLYNNFNELEKVFEENLSDFVINNIEVGDIKDLLKLLNPFQQCLESLSADESTTLNEVYLWKKKLIKHCQKCEEDTTFTKFFKAELLQLLTDEMIIDELHKVAVFLDPNFKNLKFLTEEERLETIEIVKELINKQSINERTTDGEPLVKKQKTKVNNAFLEFMDCSNLGTDEEDVQLDIKGYMDFRLSEPTTVLKFWRKEIMSSPLKLVVRSVLNIPACSAGAKQKYSNEGKIFREKRVLIKASDVDNVLFMHFNN